MDQKVFGMLSLSAKAGKILSGEDVCVQAIKAGKAKFVILATDFSPNSKKKLIDLCVSNNVPQTLFGSKENLGKVIGKIPRGVLVVLDANFAKGMIDLMGISNVVYGGEAFG